MVHHNMAPQRLMYKIHWKTLEDNVLDVGISLFILFVLSFAPLLPSSLIRKFDFIARERGVSFCLLSTCVGFFIMYGLLLPHNTNNNNMAMAVYIFGYTLNKAS